MQKRSERQRDRVCINKAFWIPLLVLMVFRHLQHQCIVMICKILRFLDTLNILNTYQVKGDRCDFVSKFRAKRNVFRCVSLSHQKKKKNDDAENHQISVYLQGFNDILNKDMLIWSALILILFRPSFYWPQLPPISLYVEKF